MRVPWVIKCSMAIGAVLALAACIDNGSLDSGDVRSSSDFLTEAALESAWSGELQTADADMEEHYDYLATRDAKWKAQHPQD